MTRVVVLADDLIWATRLRSLAAATGCEAVAARSVEAMTAALRAGVGPSFAVVDLTTRAYEPIAAIAAAAEAGASVMAVGQHDAAEARRSALGAGATRFHPYRRLAEDGPALLRAWLQPGAAVASTAAAPVEADA